MYSCPRVISASIICYALSQMCFKFLIITCKQAQMHNWELKILILPTQMKWPYSLVLVTLSCVQWLRRGSRRLSRIVGRIHSTFFSSTIKDPVEQLLLIKHESVHTTHNIAKVSGEVKHIKSISLHVFTCKHVIPINHREGSGPNDLITPWLILP